MAVERFDVEAFGNASNPLQDEPFDSLERASEESRPNRCAVVNDCCEHVPTPNGKELRLTNPRLHSYRRVARLLFRNALESRRCNVA
jgi:hypothetical protein